MLGRKARQQQQQQHNGKGVSSNGWADEDVDGFKEKEFDFQANLSMFDKEKVFAEIRASIQGEREREINGRERRLLIPRNIGIG